MTVHSFDFFGVVKGFNGTPDQKLNPPLWERGLPAMNDYAVYLMDRGA
ncbi:hypothetical protein [Pseudomonas sp. UMAB-40]|nr:hypothetical protein [Pseudomonas sp. UMAB-40]